MKYIIERSPSPSERAREIIYSVTGKSVLKENNGKPYLEDRSQFISISHSKDAVLVGFNETPIGVDIEVLREFDKRLIDRFFSDAEKNFIKDDTDFFRIWTVKEAYLKLTGEGLKNLKFNTVFDGKIMIEGYDILSFINDGCVASIVTKK
jgi:phosphopantetheinyl transferase